jgi:hypothetical protein
MVQAAAPCKGGKLDIILRRDGFSVYHNSAGYFQRVGELL